MGALSWIMKIADWLLGSRIGRWVGMILGAIGVLALAFLAGWSKKAQVESRKALEGYKRTRREMDDADLADTPTDAQRWLRDRIDRRDLRRD